jgi:hypothetical protein
MLGGDVMAIDVTTEPGKTLANLARQLADPERQARLKMLEDWYHGDPELPGCSPSAARAVRDFHEHSVSNYALLICEAVRERQRIRGIRTNADDDSTGDGEAWALWQKMKMTMVSADVHRLKARFGQAYAIVSPPAVDEPGVPIVTAESPVNCIADVDPLRPWVVRSGLKMLHDPGEGVSRAYLYRAGRLDVAEVATKSRTGVRFSPASWSWNEDLSRDLPDGLNPLVSFEALDCRAEHEPHLKLLRRINFMILQQLTIATLQAFKQRWIKGVPRTDDAGQAIDYNNIFSADPGALWLLPKDADIGESGQADLSGTGVAIRDYTKQLSACSRTPMYMFDSGGENQSAEGAALADAGLIFKVRDRNSRDELGWAQVVTTAYRWLDRPVEDVSIIWADPKLVSLSEQASALTQLASGGMPFRSRMIHIGADPAEVDRMEQELAAERLDAQIAAMSAQPAAPNLPQNGPQLAQEPANVTPASDGTPAAPVASRGAPSGAAAA